MKCAKLSRQIDPPSQVVSGPALAPILSQSCFVFAGACAGVMHVGGLLNTLAFCSLMDENKKD